MSNCGYRSKPAANIFAFPFLLDSYQAIMNKRTSLLTRVLPLFIAQMLPAAALAESAMVPDATTVVSEIGRINGLALACGESEVSARAKALVMAGVSKTRAFGEVFETNTNDAFRHQTTTPAECPPRAALVVGLEAAARSLGVQASSHRLSGSDNSEAPEVGINPRYLLQATNGRALMDGDFRDRFQLITFGYTHCPDICPTTLVEMADILKRLQESAGQVQPIFISLDPERDTLAVLRTYTNFFDSRILGLTGSPELIRRAAENFKVRHEKVVEPGSPPGRYAIDHSAGMYLLAPGGQFLARFPYGMSSGDVADRVLQEIKRRSLTAAESPVPVQ